MHNFKTRFPWHTQRVRKVKVKQQPTSPSPEDKAAAEYGTYQYSSITKTGTIRLMKLQSSSDPEAMIQCRIVNAKLKEYAEDLIDGYVALSYVWGDPKDRKAISVGPDTLNITVSLEYALRHIRHPTRLLLIWADGVCIDQNCTKDRNIQVSQMGDVYSTAMRTIIFLGPSSKETDLIMSNIMSRQILDAENCIATGYPELLKQHILDAAWFTRVWVLQELVLSVKPWVQFGNQKVPWLEFCNHMNRYRDRSDLKSGRPTSMNALKTQYERSDRTAGPEESARSMLEIINDRRGAGVSDPRDMIYAHISLCSDALKQLVPVDYSIDFINLYKDLARKYVQLTSDLSILKYAEPEQWGKMRDSVPSWVPDWTTPPRPKRPWYMSSRKMPIVFQNPDVLQIAGQIQGTIICTARCRTWQEAKDTVFADPAPSAYFSPTSHEYFVHETKILDLENPRESEIPAWASEPDHQALLRDLLSVFSSFVTPLIPELLQDSSYEFWHPNADQKEFFGGLVYEALPTLSSVLSGVSKDIVVNNLSWAMFRLVSALCESLEEGVTIGITSIGTVLVFYATVRAGDVICMFDGHYAPFVFRPQSEQGIPKDDTQETLAHQEALETFHCKFVTYNNESIHYCLKDEHIFSYLKLGKTRKGSAVMLAIT